MRSAWYWTRVIGRQHGSVMITWIMITVSISQHTGYHYRKNQNELFWMAMWTIFQLLHIFSDDKSLIGIDSWRILGRDDSNSNKTNNQRFKTIIWCEHIVRPIWRSRVDRTQNQIRTSCTTQISGFAVRRRFSMRSYRTMGDRMGSAESTDDLDVWLPCTATWRHHRIPYEQRSSQFSHQPVEYSPKTLIDRTQCERWIATIRAM